MVRELQSLETGKKFFCDSDEVQNLQKKQKDGKIQDKTIQLIESEIARSQFSTGYFIYTSLRSDTKVTKSLFWRKKKKKNMEI